MKYASIDLPPPVALFLNALSFVTGFMQVQVGSFVKNLSDANGNQQITGVGFQPKAVLIWGSLNVSTGANSILGATDGINQSVIWQQNSGVISFNTGSLVFIRTNDIGPVQQLAAIASLDSGGFTIAWTKTGSPTGTAVFSYLALGG